MNDYWNNLNTLFELIPKGVFDSLSDMVSVIDSEGIDSLFDIVTEGVFEDIEDFRDLFNVQTVKDYKFSLELVSYLKSDDKDLVSKGILMARNFELSDEILSILFNFCRDSDNDFSVRESGLQLIRSGGYNDKYNEFVSFIEEFENKSSVYSILIDWIHNLTVNPMSSEVIDIKNSAITLLNNVKRDYIYLDYLISYVENADLAYEGKYHIDMASDFWERGKEMTQYYEWRDDPDDDLIESDSDIPVKYFREKKVFDSVNKKLLNSKIEPLDFILHEVQYSSEVYIARCNIVVEILKLISTLKYEIVQNRLESMIKKLESQPWTRDFPLFSQIRNAIEISYGREGKEWTSFDQKYGLSDEIEMAPDLIHVMELKQFSKGLDRLKQRKTRQ